MVMGVVCKVAMVMGVVCKVIMVMGIVCKVIMVMGVVCKVILVMGVVCKVTLVMGVVCKVTLVMGVVCVRFKGISKNAHHVTLPKPEFKSEAVRTKCIHLFCQLSFFFKIILDHVTHFAIFCTSFKHFVAVGIGPLNSEPFTKRSSHFLILVGSATFQLLLHFSRPLMQCLEGRRFRND
jgi:hypothetical protein